MRFLGVLLIILFFGIGITSEHLSKDFDRRPFIGIAFILFLLGIGCLIIADKSKMKNSKSKKQD